MDLLWMTNIATPYTVPVWRELAKLTDFHVACMAENEFNRDWKVDVNHLELTILNARRITAGTELTLYLPTWRMLNLFWEHRPRVVVLDGWESPAFWQARVLARLVGARVVLSYWSTSKTHRFRTGPVAAIRRWFFRTADGVITPGQDATNAVLAMGVRSERITTGFATVDVDRFAEAALRLRKTLRPHPGHRYIFVGQLIPRKNVDTLLQAFSDVREPNDQLIIVGSGPLKDDLRKKANILGIVDSVVFRGHLEGEDLLYAYAGADTLVLLSHREVWGLVANEALASGLSVVASNNCGFANSLGHLPNVMVANSYEDLLGHLRSVRKRREGARLIPQQRSPSPSAMALVVRQALTQQFVTDLFWQNPNEED